MAPTFDDRLQIISCKQLIKMELQLSSFVEELISFRWKLMFWSTKIAVSCQQLLTLDN